MFITRLAIATTLACAVGAAPAMAATGTLITVPDDTTVAVQLVSPVTSADNHVDDIVDLHVTDRVNVGGYVIIAANAKGRGHVTKIDPAGGHGHPGEIEIVLDYVYAVDGHKIKLKDTPIAQEGQKAHGGATVAGIFTYGLASNAVRGGEATINTTRTLEGHVDKTVHVTAFQKATGPSDDAGFAH